MPTKVLPSILAADFSRLGAQVDDVLAAGATHIHVDVMDGHFVPPLSMGPQVVSALRDRECHLDVHLMVERPERHVADFAKAGADSITIHAEATPHVDYALQAIRDAGVQAGLAVRPATPLDAFAYARPDVALVMSVNPGWGGQKFIPASIEKIRALRAQLGEDVEIEVDGGIDRETAGPAVEAGATWLVAGSALFGADDPAAEYAELARRAGCG